MHDRGKGSCRGVIVAGIFVALSVFAYKHYVSIKHPDKSFRAKKNQVQESAARQTPEPPTGPVVDTGEPTLMDKISANAKKLASGKLLGEATYKRTPTDVKGEPEGTAGKNQEERVRNFYMNPH